MARHETKTVYHTCDMCGVKCDPLPYFGVGLRYHMDLVSTVQFKVWADIPYGTDKGDVCLDCVAEAKRKWLERCARKVD